MFSIFDDSRNRKNPSSQALWYGGLVAGVAATALIATILWRRRVSALNLQETPLERAEQLIESCEAKLDSIEKAIADLKDSRD